MIAGHAIAAAAAVVRVGLVPGLALGWLWTKPDCAIPCDPVLQGRAPGAVLGGVGIGYLGRHALGRQ